MKQVGFRGRLFLILLLFAVVPSVFVSAAWSAAGYWALPMIGSTAAWDSAAATGNRAFTALQTAPLSAEQRQALNTHEATLRTSLLMARRIAFIFPRWAPRALLVAEIAVVALLGLVALQVAGHLSRNLSRPLQELVGWTERIGRGEPVPNSPPRRGAPEFAVLRDRMRAMSHQLELGRLRAVEAERDATLRESARQVAHELKNPLTPIRFAVERLRREAPPQLADAVEVLAVESQRLEDLARSFAQFGRLPEGPPSDVDLGELARYTARATVPPSIELHMDVAEDLPMVRGHHDALARSLSNVILNAVDACQGSGRVAVSVRRQPRADGLNDAVEITVADTGCGIPAERLERIWDPYVTTKPGGTGLGLAIARQAILAHAGQVTAESIVGRGTEIRLLLPTEVPATPPPAAPVSIATA